MADVHSKKTRSFNMSRIKGKNTLPEILVRKHLFSNGFRYRLNVTTLPGKPDIVLRKYNTVIFVNGCFWHGHNGCRYFVIPKTRTDWWKEKISNTQNRDRLNISCLQEMGWKVITVWECQLKDNQEKCLENLLMLLKNND
ncbi:very short patch repair endonuclease [Marinifilum breve]|uniref:Very short patch repair endonuclease n=1 Tax=Marinifilum breve TaxID=2184082 RepID=A0A2V3ZZD1_9BACT|nr:very short patch repair endonuclease [Marinifilum breve]PXY01852.1 very short patch repair endonuclease [Marinifilum breve]